MLPKLTAPPTLGPTGQHKLELDHGVTTYTSMTNEYLVLKESVMTGGATYAFIMVMTDSLGRTATGSINITAGRPPWNGQIK